MINTDRRPRDIVVVGASAGGVSALTILLAKLPSDLPAAVAVALHRSPYYEGQLSLVLGRRARIEVREARNGEKVQHSRVYLAPRDVHMVFVQDRFELHRGPKEHYTRPAIDPLFSSAAKSHGPRVVGVQLSGSGDDGVAGLLVIRAFGGISIAQDPSEAEYPAMPLNAMLFDHVEAVLPLEGIADALVTLSAGGVLELATTQEL